MRIAFTHNLKTSEDEAQAEFDTLETVQAITEGLRALGHQVHPVEVSGPASRLVARLEALRPDLVFNTAEGSHGRYREAFYPALFEQLGLPFTGSGAYVCALTLDKQATKMMAQRAGVPTPGWAFFDAERPLGDLPPLRYPVIVKPNFEGSSKGITAESVVHHPDGLRPVVQRLLANHASGVLVEEFIVGQDITVPWLEATGVLEPASYRLEVEGVQPGFEIYDYALKNELSDQVHVEVPARTSPQTAGLLQELTARLMRELDVRDLGRADFRVTEDGQVYLIEVNALPSLEPGASLYVSAARRGLGSPALVLQTVLQSAIDRQQIQERPARPLESLRVGLAHNLRRVDPSGGDDSDAEFDSPQTVEAIAEAIARLGHEVVPLEATPELPRVLGELEVDVVFNIAEGIKGRSREAQVPALLELMDIPYTGSDAAALAVTLDKGLARRLVREAGVPTAAGALVQPGHSAPDWLKFPLMVKPNAEGSSKGVSGASVARDAQQLQAALAEIHDRYHAPALVEEFLPGREFTVGILGDLRPRTLPLMEILFTDPDQALPIYSFAHKAQGATGVDFAVPAQVDPELEARVVAVALASFEALGCRDVARVDIRLDAQGQPCFIECNPLPGLSPGFSDLCVIAEACGMDHGALVAAILAPAVRRLGVARQQGDL
jgi:D-alanine-D-alanine ligase